MTRYTSLILILFFFISSCTSDQSSGSDSNQNNTEVVSDNGEFNYKVEEFADVKILKYKIEGWDRLTENQQKLCYYLTQAGLAGRDITYDQNNKYNLRIRRALENIYTNYEGDKSAEDWISLETYLKRIWFSNGIHHHYGYKKFVPGFSKDYLSSVAEATGTEISEELYNVIYDTSLEAKKVNKSAGADLVAESANNFYEGVGMEEAKAHYDAMVYPDPERPTSLGLNSKLIKENGELVDKVWKVDGMYGAAIERIIYWLERAMTVAENETQKKGFELLIDYYKTGDLTTWDEYNLEWIKDTDGVIDYINGFIEVYDDALGEESNF